MGILHSVYLERKVKEEGSQSSDRESAGCRPLMPCRENVVPSVPMGREIEAWKTGMNKIANCKPKEGPRRSKVLICSLRKPQIFASLRLLPR